MKIRVRIFFAICAVLFVSSLFFAIAGYKAQEKALLGGVDQKLYTAALMFKATLPDKYHDNLTKDFFTQEDYAAIIVDRNNKLCKALGLQYLWSNMIVDGKVVFTTSTSLSKDVAQKDYAKFFEPHIDTGSFEKAFHTMKPVFSSFYNQWGRGRLVLVPFLNKKGQIYCFGASVGTNQISAILRETLIEYVLFFLIAIVFGFIVSIFIAGSFSEPIEKLQAAAEDIAHGDFSQKVQIAGCKEIESLSESINFMSSSINENIKRLRESEERFRNLAESISDFIWEVDENTICRYASAKVEDVLGYRADEIVGKVPFTFTDETDGESNNAILNTLIAAHRPFKNVVHRYRHKNGSLVMIESSGLPIFDGDGKFSGYRGIDRDVTTRYKLETEREELIANLQKNKSDLEKAKKELEKTKAELEALNVGLEKKIEERTKDLRSAQEKLIRSEKLAALGKVAGSLSHELRNPLGVISNAIYYLTSPGITIDSAKLDKYLNIMKSQIHDANSIIETALEFARPKSMVFKKNNLNECIDKALDKLNLPEHITIKKNYGQNLDVVFDASYMQQAIIDIVKNSIEAIEREGLIEIATLREVSNVKIIISDNGKGIDQNDIDLIFEPLFSRKSRGVGLGLSTVKDIISAHNGAVAAESAPGSGAKIIIIFPARENA